MKNFTSALFLALFLAVTATSITAQTGGQIPIVGRGTSEPIKTTTTTAEIAATVNTKNEVPVEITDYLWTIVSIIGQFKF